MGYIAPTIPDDAGESLGTGDRSDVESELDSLGRIVTETLENDYLLRDDDEQFGFFDEEYTGDDPTE